MLSDTSLRNLIDRDYDIANNCDFAEIKLEEQKSKMLAAQLDMIAKGGLPKQEELVNLRINRDRISKANEELENALKESRQELARLQAAAAKRNGSWWPFFK